MTCFLKRSLFALLAVFLSLHPIFAAEIPQGDPAELGFSAERLAKIQPAMQALVDSGKFAGVLTLIARKGKIVHFETAGLRDRELNKPMTEDTLFRIYSMTKPVTSVAIMMLYEAGKLKMDDPVSKFIPEFADTKVYTEWRDRESCSGAARARDNDCGFAHAYVWFDVWHFWADIC